MKKMLAISVMVAGVASAAQMGLQDRIALFKANTLAYVTNDAIRAEWGAHMLPPWILTNSTELAEYDSLLARKPPLRILKVIRSLGQDKLPLTYAAALRRYSSAFPHLVAYRTNPMSMSKSEIAAAYLEGFVVYRDSNIDTFRNALGSRLAPLIVPALRRHGRAVTTGPDGVSPIKTYADRISAALNAPRFNGLNEILEYLGVPARLDLELARIPTAEEAAAIVERIMSGEADIKDHKCALSAALGTDGFNAFVERYNGGSR